MSFNLEFKPSFLDSIKFLDKTFLDLINNRLNHLKENPFKYSSNVFKISFTYFFPNEPKFPIIFIAIAF